MAWLRVGDTSANHPVVLAVLEDPACDDRLVNEAYGFVLRCAVQSAANMTDYVISHGTAVQMAGQSRAQELIDVALRAGYFTDVITTADGRTAYKLVDDDSLFHMRSRDEITFERQRQRDNKNPDLIVPVRLRDGDACRYCGLVVNFHGDRRGQKAGTYDHLTRDPQSPDDMVVACARCNIALLDSPRSHREAQLMPVPAKPYFKPRTLEWLREHEYVIAHKIAVPTTSEPDMRAGRVPPGRPQGSAATRAPGPASGAERPEGPSTSTVDVDPAPSTTQAPATTETGTQPGPDDRGPVRPVWSSASPADSYPADGDVHTAEPSAPGSQPDADGHGTARAEGQSTSQVDGDPAGSAPSGRPVRSSAQQADSHPATGERTRSDLKRADRVPMRSGFTGSGRVGTGRVGPGRAGHGLAGAGRAGTGRERAQTGPACPDEKSVRRRKRR